jgi:hypothetical protein
MISFHSVRIFRLPFALSLALGSVSCTSSDDNAGTKQPGTGSDASSPDAQACPAGPSVDGWQAGADVVDLSPTQAQIDTGKLYMGAYGLLTQRGPATGIHDPITARTMVLKSGCDVITMTILDMPGISNRVIHAIGDAVSSETHLPKENIYVGATHSHSSPDLQGLWGHVPDDYEADVIQKTSQSIIAAVHTLQPADVYVSKGTAPNRNRRDWGFTDTELTVLEAQDSSGAQIATLVNFAAHPVILGAENHLLSRDFCGYTVDFLETQLGGKGLFFNGVVGDASPVASASAFDGCKEYGELVAQNAIDAAKSHTKVSPGIYRDQEKFTQEVTNAAFIAVRTVLDYDFAVDAGSMSVDTQFTYFRLGTEVQGIVFPGEALTRTGQDIKAPQKAPFHLFLGLTTDSLGYFVKSDEWLIGTPPRHNGYEESVSCGETAGDNSIRVLTGLIGKDTGF